MAQFSQRITTAINDGTWAGSWYPNGATWLLVGWNTIFTHEHYSGVRFINVAINQGETIDSAYLTLTGNENDSTALNTNLYGIDEDNTSDMSADPSGRTQTSAVVAKNFPSGVVLNTTYTWDVTAIVQEIVNRGGWANGNSMGFTLRNNSGTSSNIALAFYSRQQDSTKSALLEINYSGTTTSTTTSSSTSSSSSSSSSTTTLPLEFIGMKISKPGIDVLRTNMPNDLIFSSQYNTLKYFMEGQLRTSIVQTVDGFDIVTVTVAVNHNLNYFPFHISYVGPSWTGPNSQPQAYVNLGSGAAVYITTFITKKQLILSLSYENFTPDPQSVDTKAACDYKIYKNNLNL